MSLELRGQPFETEFNCCPRCKSRLVEWTNSRDLNVISSYVYCNGCELSTFSVETATFIHPVLPNLDYETSLLKYNAWTETKPKTWHEENWEATNDIM